MNKPNKFLVFGELVIVILTAFWLPIPSMWEACGFVMLVLAIPAGFALCAKRGFDLLVISAVYAVLGIIGGLAAPDEYYRLVMSAGGLAVLGFFPAGLWLVLGCEDDQPAHNHIRETADDDGIMYARRSV